MERKIPAQRRTEIRALLGRRGAASISEIAGALGVSDSTVRRDLESLDSAGLRAHQLARLNTLAAKVLPANRFYAEKLASISFPLKSLDELPASDVLSSRQIDEWLKTSSSSHTPTDTDMGLADEQLPLESSAAAQPSESPNEVASGEVSGQRPAGPDESTESRP